MPLYEYECSTCGEAFEAIVAIAKRDEPQPCRVCEGEAYHVITPVNFRLEGISGDFPTAYDQWAKKRKQKMAQERKLEE